MLKSPAQGGEDLEMKVHALGMVGLSSIWEHKELGAKQVTTYLLLIFPSKLGCWIFS